MNRRLEGRRFLCLLRHDLYLSTDGRAGKQADGQVWGE